MISASLKFEGWDVHSWTRWISLFAPRVIERMGDEPESSDAPEMSRETHPETRSGSLVIIRTIEGNLAKAFHSVHGRITDLGYRGPEDLPRLCETYRAKRAIVLVEGVLDDVAEKLAMRLERGDDYVAQWLTLARILREIRDAGLLVLWPPLPESIPVPTALTVRRALDLVLPDDHACVIVLWENSTPWTSAVIRRRAGEIDLVAGPDCLAQWTGPLGGDFRRDQRVIVDAVSRHVAPVQLGIFAEASKMRALLRSPDPGAWARAAATRDLILQPTPAYVAVALAADAVHAAARSSARMLGGVDVSAALAPFAQFVRGRISEIASVSSTLGFDPLRALAMFLRREQEPRAADETPTATP